MLTKMKMLSAVMILSAAVATPTFAHSAKHNADQTNFRGAYNQTVFVPEANTEYFGAPERDPSRVGGFDTSRNPGG